MWRLSVAVVCLLTGCVRKNIPDLPNVDTSGFQPAARRLIDEAMQEARTNPADAASAARAGMALHAHDQFAAAVTCYRRAAALDSQRPAYVYYQGVALSAEGKHAEALDPLSRAVALNPESLPVRLRFADALLEAGQLERARTEYRALIAKDASLAAAHFGLGRTFHGEEAIAEYIQSLALFPRYGAAQFALATEYRKAGRKQDAEVALQDYEKNRTMTPPVDDPLLAEVFALNTSSTGMIRKAQALEREGRLAEAAQVCEKVTELEPKFEQAWINLISLYGRLGEATKLERAYATAVALAPGRVEPYYNYGVFCLTANRVAEARKAFERATELDPKNADAWNNLSAAVERSGELDRAADHYRRAIALRPDLRAAHFGLGRIYAHRGRYQDAISEFEKTIQPDDENTPGYLYALAAAHVRAGHREQSIGLLTAARDKAAGRGQTALVASIERDMRTMGVTR